MNFYEKHLARQEDLKKIHDDALSSTPVGGVDSNLMCIMRITKPDDDGVAELIEESVLRRGYKIQYTAKTGMYELFNITTTDYYKYVDDTIIDEFLAKGFIRTVDEHQILRDQKRVEFYGRKIDKANSQRNDSLMVHWRQRRLELIEKISRIQESLK